MAVIQKGCKGCCYANINSKNETLANRLVDILTRLNSGEKLTVNKLAEDYAAHPKTIRRDLTRLELCHLPIQKEGKYFYLDAAYLGQLTFKDIKKNLHRFQGFSIYIPIWICPLSVSF